MNLNFGMEYHQDMVIEGKTYVLNTVRNILTDKGTVIIRTYISADLKSKKTFEQLIPGTEPKTAPAAPAAPAASAEPKKEEAKKDSKPDEESKKDKKGVFGKIFGGKDKSKKKK